MERLPQSDSEDPTRARPAVPRPGGGAPGRTGHTGDSCDSLSLLEGEGEAIALDVMGLEGRTSGSCWPFWACAAVLKVLFKS